MAAKSQLRPATAMDSVNIVRLLKQQHLESAAKLIAEFDEQKTLEYVTAAIANQYAFVVVVEASGRLLGTACMAPIPLIWSRNRVLGEAWFAVVPACRQKGVTEQMLDAIAAIADKAGLAVAHGTNLLAPEDFDDALAKRKDLIIGRTAYVRSPLRKQEAA